MSPSQHPSAGKQVFSILSGGYLLFVLYPILRADRPYNDDLLRMLSGGYTWNANGRPLTTLSMRLLEGGLPRLVDVAPLPQILAVALLALAGTLIARRHAIHSPWLAALLVLPLGAQPFFLENLSFRFDAVSMGLSVLLAVLPLTVCREHRRGFVLGALSLLGCLCSYQPSLNIFLIFVLLDIVALQCRGEEPLRLVRSIAFHIGQALLAMLAYQWMVAPSIKDWIHQHSQMIHSLHQYGVVIDNARNMGAFVLHAWPARWMLVLLPLLCITAIAPVAMGLHYAFRSSPMRRRATWIKLCFAVFALLLPFAALLCLAGPMLLLTSPIVSPRVFTSFGALLCATLVAWHLAMTRWFPTWGHAPSFVVSGIWAVAMLSFAAIYGDAQSAQQRYETQIASQLANDLAELRQQRGVTQFLLDGSAGLSPLSAHAADAFPVLHVLVASYLTGRDFHSRNFMKLFGVGMDEAREHPSGDVAADALLARACGQPDVYVRNHYALKVVDTTAVVSFTGGSDSSCPPSSLAGTARR